MTDIREMERCFLGCLLLACEKGKVDTRLKSDDFEHRDYSRLYETILKQMGEGTTPTIITLVHALSPGIECADIADLTSVVPSAANIGYYENQIYEASRTRKTRQAARLLLEEIEKGIPLNTALDKFLPALEDVSTATTVKRYLSWDEYINQCKMYDPSKDFTPSMFAGLRFPNGTLSYIGARPGGGKTTMLINIAREAITNGRKAFYVNLEMLNKAILTNFVLSFMYAMADATQRRTLNAIKNPMSEYYSLFRRDDDTREVFDKLRNEALKKIEPIIDNSLFIYDGTRGTTGTIIRDIQSRLSIGDVVLLDYVQRLPPPRDSRDQRYIQIKNASNDLLALAIRKNIVIISGAQFGRQTKDNKGKEATMDDFREGGDIEQDAHNALAIETIGEPKDGKRYAHVLKEREGGSLFPRADLECNFKYLYIAGTNMAYEMPRQKGTEQENIVSNTKSKKGSKNYET